MRKILKKIMRVLLVTVFAFGLIGCGTNSPSKGKESDESAKTTAADETENKKTANDGFSIVDS